MSSKVDAVQPKPLLAAEPSSGAVSKRRRNDADRRARQNDRLARVLRVLQLIQGRGRWTARAIAKELNCSERTIYRDLQVLEVAGIPWYFDDHDQSYRVRPGWQFPSLSPTADEVLGQATAGLISCAPGLQINAGARPLTRKLATASSADVGRLIDDAERLLAVLDLKLADHSRHQEIVQTVQWALLKRHQVRAIYDSPYKGKPLQLTLHPYRLCLAQQAWYLIAREQGLAAPHIYRVARFSQMEALDETAEPLDGFDLQVYLGNAWGVFRGGETYDVEIEFLPEAAPLVLETRWHNTQQARQHADGSATLTFRVDGLQEILWWYLGWAGRARVIKPTELRQMVHQQLRAALTLNSDAPERAVVELQDSAKPPLDRPLEHQSTNEAPSRRNRPR